MKKVVWISLFSLYVIITILVTYCLLSYNKYNIAVIGDSTLVRMKGNGYKKSSLIIVEADDDYELSDKVFYYSVNDSSVSIKLGTITKDPGNKSVTIDDDSRILENDIIGKVEDSTKIPLLGFIYTILVSRIGYLLIIILPMVIGLGYEIYRIAIEIKRKKKNEK